MRLFLIVALYVLLPVLSFAAFQVAVLEKSDNKLVRVLPVIVASFALVLSLAVSAYIVVFGDFLSTAMLDAAVTSGCFALALAGCFAGRGYVKIKSVLKK